MTSKTDLDLALADLQAMLDGRLADGGYPAQVQVLGAEWIAIADVDHDGGPDLTVLHLGKFMDVWQRAKGAHEVNPDEGTIGDFLFVCGYYDCVKEAE